jgi:hypothetical protein
MSTINYYDQPLPVPVPNSDNLFKFNESQFGLQGRTSGTRSEALPQANYQSMPISNNGSGDGFRLPTVNNPMMNAPITSYDTGQTYSDYYRYDNKQYETPTTINVRDQANEKLLNKLFQDPADILFERNNSERQWYSVPNGSVPSDQTVFAESLYGISNNCKSSSIWMRYGLPYTDDSLTCTGFNVSTPTNFGSLNEH